MDKDESVQKYCAIDKDERDKDAHLDHDFSQAGYFFIDVIVFLNDRCQFLSISITEVQS